MASALRIGLNVAFVGAILLGAIGMIVYMPAILAEIRNDEDLDGLSDDLEASIGTDPTDNDTDGDRLPDAWEHRNETADGEALPDADPLRKDLYVQINYAKGVEPLTAQERQDLKAIWQQMPVRNPSGEPGIAIHIDATPPDGGELAERLTAEFDTHVITVDTSSENPAPDYTSYVPEDRQCVYHLALLVYPTEPIDFENGKASTVGFGDAPGYLVKVDGHQRDIVGQYMYRPRVLTHELLHNIVGQIQGGHHTTEGWLSHHRDEYLSDATAAKLNGSGFNESTFFEQQVC